MHYGSFPFLRAIHVEKYLLWKISSIEKYLLWKKYSMEKNSMKLFHNPLLIFTQIPKPLMSVVSKKFLFWILVRRFTRRLSWLLP